MSDVIVALPAHIVEWRTEYSSRYILHVGNEHDLETNQHYEY